MSKACFTVWKTEIVKFVDHKIEELEISVKPINVKHVLKDPSVISNLAELHHKFVMVPIDKAANNVAFICKRFYAATLLKEMGLIGEPSCTYQKINDNPINIIEQLKMDLKGNFNIIVNEDLLSLPVAYWLPKMHIRHH